MRSARRSLTFRITLLFATVATGVLLLLGLLIGRAVEQHFVEQDVQQLQGKLQLAAHLLQQVWLPEDLQTLPQQLDAALVGHHDLALQLNDAQGHTVFATPHAHFPDALFSPGASGLAGSHPAEKSAATGSENAAGGASVPDARPHTWMQDDIAWRGITAALPTGMPGSAPMQIAIAINISHHQHFMASFRQTLWLFVVLAALLTGVLGWWAVRRGLAPLRVMRNAAATVTAHHLDRRLDAASVPAELADLAQTLNEMLRRLQESFARLTEFSADLAHELRTPISNLMTETQVTLAHARSDAEYREVLASNMEEYERLARMISDMLFLAQTDQGLVVPRREAVDLAAEVNRLFEFFEALAADKSLQLSLQVAPALNACVQGDALMLRRALANLLANAIHHTAAQGRIAVTIAGSSDNTGNNHDRERERDVIVAVENSGEPIAAEHRARIFDRFYRADPSRQRGGDGAGLGLAISRAIARAHCGDITLADTPAGVRFEIRLPAESRH